MKKNYVKTTNEKLNSGDRYVLKCIFSAVFYLMFFFSFVYIWNTSFGTEAQVNGFNIVFCTLGNASRKTGLLYGDMAVPFYYYAKIYMIVLGIMVTTGFFLGLIQLLLSILGIKIKKPVIDKISLVVDILLVVVMLASFITALAVNGSRVLPIYCSNNPKCSIQSLAIFPFFVSVGQLITTAVTIYKRKDEE